MTERRFGPDGERLCCPTVGGQPHTDACEAIWRGSRNFPTGPIERRRRWRDRFRRKRGELDEADKRERLSGETRPPWEKSS